MTDAMRDRIVTILPARRRQITLEQANAAFDILVEHAGAHEDDQGHNRYAFIYAVFRTEQPCDC